MLENKRKSIDILSIFKTIPGCHLVLLPDAPVFTIAEATDAYLAATYLERAKAIGQGVFETHTDNPGNPHATGVRNLSASLHSVLEHTKADRMADQRYDVFNPATGQYEMRIWSTVNTPVFSSDGAVQYIIHTVEDITEKVRLRDKTRIVGQKLEESEEKYHKLFQSIDQGFCIIEMIFDENNNPLDYRFLEINPVFEKQSGLKDAAGKTMRELVPDHDAHWFEIYGKVALTGEAIRFEEKSETLKRWFDVFAYRQDGEESNKVVILFKDITGRKNAEAVLKRSEQHLRNTIMQAPVAMCIFRGEDFVIEVANPSMFEFWGKSAGEVMHKPLFAAIPEAKNQGYEELMTTVLRTGEPFSAKELTVTLPRNGLPRQVYINFSYTPIHEIDGTISGILAVAMDVTEQVMFRKKIEQSEAELQQRVEERTKELEILNLELNRSNRYLGDFAHAASHDMKEPLRKIRTFADRLKQSMGTRMEENETMMLERMQAAARRMQLLVDDLLEFSHVSNTHQEIEAVDLNEKVHKVLGDLELPIEEKGAKIIIDQLPVIRGNARQMEQLFHNLVGNSLKYSKKEVTPEISIRAARIHGTEAPVTLPEEVINKTFYIVEVRDNGIGFEQQYAERIFNIFQRLHGKAEYAGTGIGLSIVKKVVENHNGYIWAEGKEGEGAAFKVLLPAE